MNAEPDTGELALKTRLDRLVAPPAVTGDWRDVQARVRRKRRHRQGVGVVAAAVVVAAGGLGGYAAWEHSRADRGVLVLSDTAAGNLTGVRGELWAEIERVRQQTRSGALAWVDIQASWAALVKAQPWVGNDELTPESWLAFLDTLEQQLLDGTASGVDVTIFLKDSAGDLADLQGELSAMPEVESVTFVSKDDALERLKAQFKESPDVLSGLTGNPLPASFEIKLKEGQEADAFAAKVRDRPGIDQVSYGTHDYQDLLGCLRALTPSTSSTTVAARELDTHGLWAGNVQTAPEHPVSLPDEFHEQPELPADLATGTPLWVFPAELTPQAAAAAINAADDARTVVLFDPSEELCELLKIEKGIRPSFAGEIDPIFVQRPVIVRSKSFADAPANWYLYWADFQVGSSSAPAAPVYDPLKIYAVAAELTWRVDAGIAYLTQQGPESAEAAGGAVGGAQSGGSNGGAQGAAAGTDTTDLYPYFKDLQSDRVEKLARKAVEELRSLSGLTFAVDDAEEQQQVGAGGVELVLHRCALTSAGPEKKHVYFTVFWSPETQVYAPTGLVGGPLASFDAGEGSIGVVSLHVEWYQAMLQLADGMTVNVTCSGPDWNESGWVARRPVAEVSPLTAQQLIEFSKWLVVAAGYLHPATTP